MNIQNIETRLEEKWGKLIKENNFASNCPMPFISSKAKLNVLFKKESLDKIEQCFKTDLNSEILPQLKDFYGYYNGCNLFFSSLNIFGLQQHPNDTFEPYDIVLENYNIKTEMDCNGIDGSMYVFLGSLGGEYVFAYKKNELSTIYTMKKGCDKIEKKFNSFNEWLAYYFEILYNKYDIDGKKIDPNKEYKSIPSLYHLTYKLF